MVAITSLSFSALIQCSERKVTTPSTCFLGSNSHAFRLRMSFLHHHVGVRPSNSAPKVVVLCMSSETDITPVSETKLNFIKAHKRPIPSIYNTVLQGLLVQQHLMRYKRSYRYDPVFAPGFVTAYDQLIEGYPSDEDRDAIFKAYVEALKEDPNQYRCTEVGRVASDSKSNFPG